jgi:alpha-beta hydrolase superfamily lysophospholipase
MTKPERPKVPSENEGRFFTTKNGCKLFVYDYLPSANYNKIIFVISGITGINHHAEMDIIEQLSNNCNRVVVIHPRGTGYSEGTRGDMSDFSDFTRDYVEVIQSDKDYVGKQHKIVLFGHSMSSAVALAVVSKLENVGGVILVNPPYQLKNAKGISPSIGQYIKYACYMVFAKHKPIVNMAGDPSLIENKEDREESEKRINDPLLVKYFSMYMMLQSKELMDSMLYYSKKADYPFLLIYGEKDNIVGKNGCNMIYNSWKSYKKQYVLIKNGTHGKSTVKLAKNDINDWLKQL